MKLRRLVGLGLLVGGTAASLGCNGHTTLGDDGTAGDASSDPGGSAGTGGTGADAAGSGGMAQGGGSAGGPPAALDLTPPTNTCAATCEDAAGTLQALDSVEEFYRHLVGRWLICSGGDNTFLGPDDIIGVEYEAPTLVASPYGGNLWQGNMNYLVAGANGAERGKGFGYQLTYDVSPQDGGRLNRINMHPGREPTSFVVAMFQYSPCPNEWLITGEAAADRGALLVPLD